MKSTASIQDGAKASTPIRDLTRRWFLYLLSIRQLEVKPGVSEVQGHLDGLLREMDREISAAPALNPAYQQVRPILVYFADEVLLNCGWSDESAWALNLMEHRVLNTRHAGSHFFTLLNEELARGNRDTLEIYYKCLSLGFRGALVSKALQLAALRQKVLALLISEPVQFGRFCPEAYEAIHSKPFVKFPLVARARVALAFLLILALIYLLGYSASILQMERIRKREGAINAEFQEALKINDLK